MRLPEAALERLFTSRITILTGNYGSGKTELAVNLALSVARAGESIHLVDLDFLKPCFRSRELRGTLEAGGVDVVAPRGVMQCADLPVILPSVSALLTNGHSGRVLVDLAGDPGGAKMIAQFATALAPRQPDLLLVVNTRRPFAGTIERIAQAVAELSEATRLPITGLVANTNLGADTVPAMIRHGYDLTAVAAERLGLPIRAVAIPDFLRGQVDERGFAAPTLWLRRYVLPPWEAPADTLADAYAD